MDKDNEQWMDECAMMAMQGLLSGNSVSSPKNIAQSSYNLAEYMWNEKVRRQAARR